MNVKGFLSSLLDFIRSSAEYTNEEQNCQSASVYLKMGIVQQWKYEDEISKEDRAYLKDNIIDTMSLSNDIVVLNSIEDCLQVMADYDFPGEWGNLLFEIGDRLSADTPKVIYTSLKALRCVIGNFSSSEEDTHDSYKLPEQAYMMLETLLGTCMENWSEMDILMMIEIVGIFKATNQYEI